MVHSFSDSSTRAAGLELAAVASAGTTVALTALTQTYSLRSEYQPLFTVPTGSEPNAKAATATRATPSSPMITRRHR